VPEKAGSYGRNSTSFKWNRLPNTHIVDRYMETVQSFGVRNDGSGLDYFIPEQDRVKENDIPASHHAGYIAIVIGAAVNTKKYPLEKLKQLCSTLEHPVILLGGPEDAAAGESVCETDPIKIYNACGRFSLNESADLVRRAKLVVSNDTGLMHIAAAFKRPVISLWGNTVPEFGMYPYYGQNYLHATSGSDLPYDLMEVKNLSCRPCSKIGYKKCPRGHFKCMQNIDAASVLERINHRILKK
jgi:ADP-heptose:LPS heptosyltransferase